MAHETGNIDRGVTGNKVAPWHIGETRDRWSITDSFMTPWDAACLGLARQDGGEGWWDPATIAVYARAGGSEFVQVPGVRAVVRDDMGLDDARRFLTDASAVSDKYELFTNSELVAYADALVAGGAHVESCGSLFNGKRVYFSIHVPGGGEILGEPVTNHLLLTTAHNGSGATEAVFGPVMTVCNNTLQWNRSKAKSRVSVRHTKNATERLAVAKSMIEVATTRFGSTLEAFRMMATRKLAAGEASQYVKDLLAIEPDAETKQTRKKATAEAVLELYNGRQIGADLPSRRGTLFGLVNAVSQYVETGKTVRVHKAKAGGHNREADVRMNSIVFGSGAKLRDKALDAAWELVK